MSGGIITTVAGNGTYGYNGDNIAATSAGLYLPDGVAVNPNGNLFIADYGYGPNSDVYDVLDPGSRIRKVSGGIITTVAGNGTYGYNGDNIAATSAELSGPSSVALDTSGNVFVADSANNRVRKLTPLRPANPQVSPGNLVLDYYQGTDPVTAAGTVSLSSDIPIHFTVTSPVTWLTVYPGYGLAPGLRWDAERYGAQYGELQHVSDDCV